MGRARPMLLVFALCAALLAAAPIDAHPAAALTDQDFTNTSFVETTGVTEVSLSRDGLWTVYSNAAGTWSVPTAGGRKRLLSAASNIAIERETFEITSDSSQVVYARDGVLYAQPIAGGPERVLLAAGAPGSAVFGRIVDGDQHVVATRYAPPIFSGGQTPFVVPMAGGAARELAPGNTTAAAGKFSPDGRYILFSTAATGMARNVYEHDIVANQTRLIVADSQVLDTMYGDATDYVAYVVKTGATSVQYWSIDRANVARRLDQNSLGLPATFSVVANGLDLYFFVGSSATGGVIRAPMNGSASTVLVSWTTETDAVSASQLLRGHFVYQVGTSVRSLSPSGATRTLLTDSGMEGFVSSADESRIAVLERLPGPVSRVVSVPVDGSQPPDVAANFDARVLAVGPTGTVLMERTIDATSNGLWAGGSGALTREISRYANLDTLLLTDDGRRAVVMADRTNTGNVGLTTLGPSYAAGEHGKFVGITPARVLDTRPQNLIGYSGAKPGPGGVVQVQIRGRGGVPNTTDVRAVVLNLTATQASAPGFITVWPTGQPRPNASNLNLERVDQTRPNMVTVPVGADGSISIFTETGTHLLADVAGYYSYAANATDGRLFPLPPQRLLDTRSGARPAAGATVTLPVLGRAGVPSNGVSAVVLTVTATDSAAGGYVTVWPSGTRPEASNLNLEGPGHTVANQVLMRLGPDGAIRLFTDTGTHLVVDVAGWFTDYSEDTGNSGLFHPVNPTRVLDTRACCKTPTNIGPKPAANSVTTFRYGTYDTGVAAVAVNVTMADTDTGGYLTVFPSQLRAPLASNMNVTRQGQVIATHATTAVDPRRLSVGLFTLGGTHLIADVSGTYTN